MEEVKVAETKTHGRTDKEYRRLKRYQVITLGGQDFLIKKMLKEDDPILYFVANEHLFEKIEKIHIQQGHGGVNKTLQHVKKQYHNITQDAVKLYIEFCETCQKNRSRAKSKSVVVKPIRSSHFNSRCQVDLIDMQSLADGEYRWILNYQDHFTKFVQLRPLKSKNAIEVADTIVDIFLTSNGAPVILQTDCGREFVNKTLKRVSEQWPGMKLVRGRSRYPQSQGSVESANKEVSKMLKAWMNDNKTTNWARGLKFVQFQKNSSHHFSLKMSPCEALYGQEPSRGLESTGLEFSTFDRFETEDDLWDYMESITPNTTETTDDNEMNNHMQPPPITQTTAVTEENNSNPMYVEIHNPSVSLGDEAETINFGEISNMDISPINDCDNDICVGECNICDQIISPGNIVTCRQCSVVVHITCAQADICERCCRANMRINKRAVVNTNQERVAKKMKGDSDKQFQPLQVGDNVRVFVERVDRGNSDYTHLIGVVSEIVYDSYRVGTISGTLNQLFSRSQLQKTHQTHIKLDDVPDHLLSVRAANAAVSIGNGQGYERCTCQQGCKDNRCSCRKKGLLCNSYCHKSQTCTNKG